jgi:D-glycero-alpha-D-manno-heptose 1-phosphate guanylyltransferase
VLGVGGAATIATDEKFVSALEGIAYSLGSVGNLVGEHLARFNGRGTAYEDFEDCRVGDRRWRQRFHRATWLHVPRRGGFTARNLRCPELPMALLEELTAVILAGGLGTRLRSAVADRPKALAEINGRPFLAYLLDGLVAAGVREAVLCTGYLGEQIRAHFGKVYGALSLAYSQESEPRGTAGALRLALPLIGSHTALVLNGDTLSNVNLFDYATWMERQGALLALALVHVADTDRFGGVEADALGWVRTFEEKGQHRGAGWINAGTYLIPRRIVNGLSSDSPLSLERDVLPQFIGHGLAGYCSTGRLLDIGTPESYALAPAFIATRAPP